MKPSYEELEQQLVTTQQKLAATEELLRIALDRIAKLEEQINKNSKNSSKPPSSDQKSNTPKKDKKKRQSRKGVNREQIPQDRVDQHVHCTLENCPHCGSSELQEKKLFEVLQQVELPEVKAIVTEYILKKFWCKGCGKSCSATLPEGIPSSVFGPKMMALVATLTGGYLLPKRDAIRLIKDLYDIDIGLGSIPNIEERVTKALLGASERIHRFVLNSDLSTHFDETGWRDSGKRHYTWMACNEEASIFKIYRFRSGKSFKSFTRGKQEFVAVTDRYAVYRKLKGVHQYCLAHLIRDFQKYAERDGPDGEIGHSIVQLFQKACKIHADYRQGKISWRKRNQGLGRLKKKLSIFFADAMANGSDSIARLSERLWDEAKHIWAFMKIKGVEPTNNLAERNLRNLVIRRKRSYGTRSDRGKAFVETITTICVTAKQQGINLYRYIIGAVTGYFSKMQAPLMAPKFGF